MKPFWRQLIAASPDYLKEHPCYDEIVATEGEDFLPIRIFGDDGALGKKRGITLLHWAPICSETRTTQLWKIPMCLFEKKFSLGDDTYNPVFEVLVWSLNQALYGLYPLSGHDGRSFHGRRGKLGGRRIMGKYRLVFLFWVCDWAYSASVFHLKHCYKFNDICHLCFATAAGANWFGRLDRCFPLRRHIDYMTSLAAAQSPLSQIIGFHTSCILPEMMHCGPLGVHLIVGGACLYELCSSHHFGRFEEKRWDLKLDLQLAAAYRSFRAYCKHNHLKVCAPMFKKSKLSMKRTTSRPVLKYKAYAALVIVDWLAMICVEQARASTNEYVRARACLLSGLSRMFRVFREGGVFLDDAEVATLQKALDAFVPASYTLSMLSREEGRSHYHLIPKHHMIVHACRTAIRDRLNPGCYWTFSDEDMMRVIMTSSSACSGLAVHKAGLERWLLQFFGAYPLPCID